MTRGNFNFQIVQDRNQPIVFSGLNITHQVKMQQGEQRIMIDENKIEELIQTLRACKKWLSSP